MPLINIAVQAPRVPAGQKGGNRPGTFQTQSATFRRDQRFLAEEVQANVVDLIQQRRMESRRSASTGRLVKATASPENIFISPTHIRVGMPQFLDNSIAKYWRTFEEGSANTFAGGFIGTPLWFKGKAGFPSYHGQIPGVRTVGEGGTKKPVAYVKNEIEGQWAYRDASRDIGPKGSAIFGTYLRSLAGLPVLNP